MAVRRELSPQQIQTMRRNVLRAFQRGMPVEEIIKRSGYSEAFVRKQVNRREVRLAVQETNQEVKKEIFKNKVPTLKNIVGTTLNILNECLHELSNPGRRKEMVKSVSDLRNLSTIITDLNNLIRLELGQSTENIEVKQIGYQETRVILQELSKIDPVFEYPKLPDAS